ADRSSLLIYLNSNVAPAKGAAKLLIKGKLILIAGLKEKTTEEKEVAMKEKTEAKLGDFTLKVTQEKGFAPGSGAMFTISSTRPNIKTVVVKDAKGNAVAVLPQGAPYGFGKNWTTAFSLKTAVAQPKVAVTWFSEEEKVTVPVD